MSSLDISQVGVQSYMKSYKLRYKSLVLIAICLVQFVLFEFWLNLVSHLKRSLSSPPSIQVIGYFSILAVNRDPRQSMYLNLDSMISMFTATNSVGHRQRSFHLFYQIAPTAFRIIPLLKRATQILMKYPGYWNHFYG